MRSVVQRQQAPQTFFDKFPEHSRCVAQLLYNRGLSSEEAIESFLNPEYHHSHDPFLFHDMRKAVDRIYRAIQDGELIAVHGDYDADGVSGTVILTTVLARLGAQTHVFIPHREKDGYGLNKKTVDYLSTHGTKLIITCDCGISNAVEIEDARSRGIDTIVTDHHLLPDHIPPAHAIIHPKRAGETYPFKELAGGGVAFKLAQALLGSSSCGLTKPEREAEEKWLLDLVAIATVADMVDLVGENRVFVKYGLIVLSKTRRVGLRLMLSLAGIDVNMMTAETIAFKIAPRINAAGRMDHANGAYRLLTTTDDGEAKALAQQLESHNADRQAQTDAVYRESLRHLLKDGPYAVFAYDESWPVGLTGLVSGRLSKQFNKPAFVITSDGRQLVASGRAPDDVNILESLKPIKHTLSSFGGHPQACGFRFAKEQRDTVVQALYEYFDKELRGRSMNKIVAAECEVDFKDITWDLMDALKKFQPFGQGNPEPLLMTRSVTVHTFRPVGQKKNHLKLQLSHENHVFDAIAFDSNEQSLKIGEAADIVYHIRLNAWNGVRSIQLNIKHIARHD